MNDKIHLINKIELIYFLSKRFEPRSHLKNRLSLTVQVNVVLNRNVAVDSDWRFDNQCGSHLQSQSELYHVSWWYYNGALEREAPWVRKYGKLPIRENLVFTWPYIDRSTVRPHHRHTNAKFRLVCGAGFLARKRMAKSEVMRIK